MLLSWNLPNNWQMTISGWREVRAEACQFPVDLDVAKGHLSASTLLSMSVKPHIVHVVSYCEMIMAHDVRKKPAKSFKGSKVLHYWNA